MQCADQVSAGHEAAAHLVLALRARLEALDATFDAVIDALVVAGLEVQAVEIARRRPSSARTAPPRRQNKTATATGSPW